MGLWGREREGARGSRAWGEKIKFPHRKVNLPLIQARNQLDTCWAGKLAISGCARFTIELALVNEEDNLRQCRFGPAHVASANKLQNMLHHSNRLSRLLAEMTPYLCHTPIPELAAFKFQPASCRLRGRTTRKVSLDTNRLRGILVLSRACLLVHPHSRCNPTDHVLLLLIILLFLVPGSLNSS